MEQEYISLRNKYLPENIKAVFVLESPPEGHGYFYNPDGKVSEVLFRAFMKLIDFVPVNKDEGLRELAVRGYVLINPIYVPVNKLPDRQADKIIMENYSTFVKDLEGMIKNDKSIPVVLVKSNILRLLEQPLLYDGFIILNKSLLVPFPLHYHVNSFLERIRGLISQTNPTASKKDNAVC
jgi:hypothetical protein